jgi:hypothetical protein
LAVTRKPAWLSHSRLIVASLRQSVRQSPMASPSSPLATAGVRWLPLLTAAASALRSSAMAARDDRESKARRRVARTLVATYHEAELAGLVEHVAAAIERYRADELDVHDVDEVIHRYRKATQALWKFCFRRLVHVITSHGSVSPPVTGSHLRSLAAPKRADWRRLTMTRDDNLVNL